MSRHRNPRARIPELGELWNPEACDEEETAQAEAEMEDARLEAWLDSRDDS